MRKKIQKTKLHDNKLRNDLRRLKLRWWGRPAALVLVGAVSFSPAAVTSVFSSQSALTSVVAIFALTIFESEQASTEQLPSRALCWRSIRKSSQSSLPAIEPSNQNLTYSQCSSLLCFKRKNKGEISGESILSIKRKKQNMHTIHVDRHNSI